MTKVRGLVFDVDTFAVHDGPGVRLAVYLKGCPLSCRWCHSPESQRPKRELIIVRDRCTMCGACAAVCPQKVHTVDGSDHSLTRAHCAVCGLCVEACVHGALEIKGDWLAASDVIARAQRMRPFFEHSGGGITLSGGEVTAQVEFCAAVLVGCQGQGIHTAIETCGAASWDRLGKLAQHADLILYDIKLLDEDAHRRWTGAPNGQILDNVRHLVARGYSVQIRVPLIPGITDTRENLCAIAAFVRDAGLTQIALLPYNESASAKYEWLDRSYEIAAEPGKPEQLDALLQVVRAAGLDAVVV